MSGSVFREALLLASELEEREMEFFLLNCRARGLADLSKRSLEAAPTDGFAPIDHPWRGTPLESLLTRDKTHADANKVKVMKSRLLAKLRKDKSAARSLALLGFAAREEKHLRRYKVCDQCKCTVYVETPPHAKLQPGEVMVCPVCVSGRLQMRELPDELKIWPDRRKEILYAAVENRHEIDTLFDRALPLTRRRGGRPDLDLLKYLEQFDWSSPSVDARPPEIPPMPEEAPE